MPMNGLLGRTRSFRSRRAEGGLDGALGLVSRNDARDEEIPDNRRRTASPPTSKTTATIYESTPPNTFCRPTRVQQVSTESCCLSSPNSPASYGSSDGKTIGLALGSPHESPLPPLPLEDRLEKQMADCKFAESNPRNQGDSYANHKEVDSEKPRMVKWRSFSGLFGRKRAISPSAPLYQVQSSGGEDPEQGQSQPLTIGRVLSDDHQPLVLPSQQRQVSQMTCSPNRVHDNNSSAQSQRRVRSRRKDIKPAASPIRPKLPLSKTCPKGEHRATCPVPPPKDVETKPGIATLQFNGSSLLQVEIPSVQLERYSVMFENLLRAPPSSSLLARRHGHLEELGSIDQFKTQVTASLNTQQLPSLSRAHSTSPARSPGFSLFPPIAVTDNRQDTSLRKRVAPSSLHRSLTSPILTSSQTYNPLVSPPLTNDAEPNHDLLVIERSTDSQAMPRLQRVKADLDPLRHSHASTEKSFHTAAESQSIDPISNPPKSQQELPKCSSSVKDGQSLRSSKSGVLPAVFPAGAMAHNVRGYTFELQNGQEKRDASVAAGQVPATTPPTHLEDSLPEIKPAPPLRVLKNGYIPNLVAATTALASAATELPKKTEQGATLLQNGRERKNGTTRTISPPASHHIRPRISATNVPSIPISDMPVSAPPLPPRDSKTSMQPSQTIIPEPILFSPRPLAASSTGPRPSTLPPLSSAQETPEKAKNAAEISIARQISISRRQRELLAPLAPKYARQPMQPMLVDVRGGTSMARKSSHLIVEDA